MSEPEHNSTDGELAAVQALDRRLASAERGERERIKDEVAVAYGLSKRQLWRVYQTFKAEGPAGLAPHAGPRKRESLATEANWFGRQIASFLLVVRSAGPTQVSDALALACQREGKPLRGGEFAYVWRAETLAAIADAATAG